MVIFFLRCLDSFIGHKDDLRAPAADALRVHQQRRFAAQPRHILQRAERRVPVIARRPAAQQAAVLVEIDEPRAVLPDKPARIGGQPFKRRIRRHGEQRFAQRVDAGEKPAAAALPADHRRSVLQRQNGRRRLRRHAGKRDSHQRVVRSGRDQHHPGLPARAIRRDEAAAAIHARHKARRSLRESRALGKPPVRVQIRDAARAVPVLDNQRQMRRAVAVVGHADHVRAAVRADRLDRRSRPALRQPALAADDQPFQPVDPPAGQHGGNLPVFVRKGGAHLVSAVLRRAVAPKRRALAVQAKHPPCLIAPCAHGQVAVARVGSPDGNQPVPVFNQPGQAIRAAPAVAARPFLRQSGRAGQQQRRQPHENPPSHVRLSPSPCSAQCAAFSRPHRPPRPSPRRRRAPPRSGVG